MHSPRERFIAFLMLLPSIIVIGIFVYFFIGQNIYYSITDWGTEYANEGAALSENIDRRILSTIDEHPRSGEELDLSVTQNYSDLMTSTLDFKFRTSLVNTFFFTIFFLVGCISIGFILAFLLDQNVVGEGIFRTIFLYPMSLSFVVTGTIWRWLFNPTGGINTLPYRLTHTQLFGGYIFPKFLRVDTLEYGWLNSETQIWIFKWADVPRHLTLLGLFILGIVAFNNIFAKRWRILAYASIALIVLRFGYYLNAWHGYLDGQPHFIRETIPDIFTYAIILLSGVGVYNAIYEKNWKGLAYSVVGAFLIYLFYSIGGWGSIWLPLDTRAFDTTKGYNVAMNGIIIAAVWQMSGYVMALFLAGIRGISEDLREAARVDGCSEWQVYIHIILPGLRPITLSAMIILGHISLKIFDLVFAMAPGNRFTVVPGVILFNDGYGGNEFATASAIGVVMLAMVSLVIVPYLWTNLREESH